MAGNRGDFVGEHARQAKGPILRIGDDGLDPVEQIGKTPFLPEELRADIEATRQPGRAGFGKGRPDRIIFGGEVIRAGMLIIQHRQGKLTLAVKHDDRRAVGGDRDRLEAAFRMKLLQCRQDEGP